jgi:pimeloyl-ACP methyl ester carboxylesterase
VVLLHGWTSTAALNWFRCLDDCADDIADLVTTLDLGPVIAVGYSMGGPIAQLLWRRHPEVVRGLVLCATACRFAGRPELSGPFGAVSLGLSVALAGLPESLRRLALSRLIRSRTAESPLAAWALTESEASDPSALVQAGLALNRFDSSPWIGDIDIPTAVIVTARDMTVSPARQWQMARAIPGVRPYVVRADHRACVDAAREFVPTLITACAAVSRPTAGRRSSDQAGSSDHPGSSDPSGQAALAPV